jgi:predicted MFS family arabinose efflux permease
LQKLDIRARLVGGFHMPIGLLALALGGFGIGLTEFGIMGLAA